MEEPRPYSRANPSPRYRELIRLYERMHAKGLPERGLMADETFKGKSLPRQVVEIKELIDRHGAKSLLDYGAGKAYLYWAKQITFPDGQVFDGLMPYWGIESIALYDPGYARFNVLPTGRFDAVISTDVLEHCPEEDIPWILAELFSYARRFVFANIACFAAKKSLPNGENAHATVKPPEWWEAAIVKASKRYPDVAYSFILETVGADGLHKTVFDSAQTSVTQTRAAQAS
ncbi:MAG: class I SAM-dependent methyltransferase [Alphaproteobacteria bacterium]